MCIQRISVVRTFKTQIHVRVLCQLLFVIDQQVSIMICSASGLLKISFTKLFSVISFSEYRLWSSNGNIKKRPSLLSGARNTGAPIHLFKPVRVDRLSEAYNRCWRVVFARLTNTRSRLRTGSRVRLTSPFDLLRAVRTMPNSVVFESSPLSRSTNERGTGCT